jgi:hypothetical protein
LTEIFRVLDQRRDLDAVFLEVRFEGAGEGCHPVSAPDLDVAHDDRDVI